MEELVLCEICSERIEGSVGIVNCAICDRIQHCSCAGLLQSHLTEITAFHCFLCETIHGETEYIGKTNKHRRNFLEDAADEKPVQTCTPVFIEELKYRQFSSVVGVLKNLAAHELTLAYLKEHGFIVPILVKDNDGLDVNIPPSNFDIASICELVGKDFLVDVVDVTQQNNFQIRFQDFLSYFCSKHRKFAVYIPSLDISNTRLEYYVQSPSIVRELDWVERFWPVDLTSIKPHLQKYFSVSTKDSYVDFHTTFGGSSVWYCILEGEKMFYFIEPTENNLDAFQVWMSSPNKSETFFANKVNCCYQLVMKKGETVFIPTGWIYASLTLSDCLVFGGNFLHELNISFQLRIHDIESITSKGNLSYPMFELANMYAGFHFVEELQRFNQTKCKVPENKVSAIKALVERIKLWVHSKEHMIFKHIGKLECQKLVKDLSKQVKQAERIRKSPKMAKSEIVTETNVPVLKEFIGSVLKEDDKSQRLKMTLKKVTPPVKLTLPKPSTYPYRNNKIIQEGSGEVSKLSQENVSLIDHPWSIADASHSNGDLKIKLRIGRQSPDVKITQTSQSICDSHFQSSVKPNENNIEETSKSPLEIEQEDSSQLCGQNEVSKVASAVDGNENITCSNADSNSDGSSSDIEVVFVGKNSHYKHIREHLDDTPSETSGNCKDDEDLMASGGHTVIPHSSSNSVLDMTSLSARLLSPLSYTEPFKSDVRAISAALQTSNTISEILSGSTAETGIGSSLTTGETLHPALQDRKIIGLAQIDYSLAAEPKPTTSRTTGGSMRSTILLSSEAEGKLSICSRTRPNRKKKTVSRHQNKKNLATLEDGHTEMGRVHEDDSFVYLSLETSDEEEEPVRKFRGKQYIDETWCPGARLGPLLPRVEKPIRDVKRNQAIEKGLEAAAAKKAGLPPPKRPYHIRKKRVPRPVATSVAEMPVSGSTTPGITVSPPVIASKRKAKKMMKPKRGMATAKQRLGKY